jgi:hypothetical protein
VSYPDEAFDAAQAEIARLKEELAELQATFDLRWKADRRAIAMWEAEDPKRRALMWPDHADLVVWLMGRLLPRPEPPQQCVQGYVHDCQCPKCLAKEVVIR